MLNLANFQRHAVEIKTLSTVISIFMSPELYYNKTTYTVIILKKMSEKSAFIIFMSNFLETVCSISNKFYKYKANHN